MVIFRKHITLHMKRTVVRVVNYHKLLVVLYMVCCGCDRFVSPQHEDAWTISSGMYFEEKAMLQEVFGNDFRFDWSGMAGVCSRFDWGGKDHFQINWSLDGSKLSRDVLGRLKLPKHPCMTWLVKGNRVYLMRVFFYLGRKYRVIDEMSRDEEEQYLEVDLRFKGDSTNWDGEFFWRITRGVAVGSSFDTDQITDEVFRCMQGVWTLSATKNPKIFHFCPFSRRREFMEILSRALSVNGFAAPFRVGGCTTKEIWE